jgi:hypothetical protein
MNVTSLDRILQALEYWAIDSNVKESLRVWTIGLLPGLLTRQAPLTPRKYYLSKKHMKKNALIE